MAEGRVPLALRATSMRRP